MFSRTYFHHFNHFWSLSTNMTLQQTYLWKASLPSYTLKYLRFIESHFFFIFHDLKRKVEFVIVLLKLELLIYFAYPKVFSIMTFVYLFNILNYALLPRSLRKGFIKPFIKYLNKEKKQSNSNIITK